MANWTLLIILSAAILSSGHADSYSELSCKSELELSRDARRDKLSAAFNQFERAAATPANIWRFEAPRPKGTRIVDLERVQPQQKIWNKLKWSFKGTDYDFVDVGLRNLELDSLKMNSEVANHLLLHPDQNLELHYSKAWLEAEETLSDWNFMLLNAVKDMYRRKVYLGTEDFYLMDEIGSASSNSDTFALLKGSERDDASPAGRTPLVTIQVRYHGDRNAFSPTLKGVLQSQGLSVDESQDRYPFEYRLDPKERETFRSSLYRAIPSDSTCEIIRFTKFQNIPKPVLDKIILSVFRRIKLRRVQTILIGTDSYSIRLFKRYGFRPLMRMPVIQNQIPEYLGFLRVNSNRFEAILRDLALRSQAVLQNQD